MKVVLLAGGFGTRMAEDNHPKPKPMVEIGGMPILWHIMKEYSYYGFNDFIICTGYMQGVIKNWFAEYFQHSGDLIFDYTDGKSEITVRNSRCEPWKVTIADTGTYTMTGGRIKRIREYVDDETFMMTYGDGVCDVNIAELVKFHQSHGKIATLTAVSQQQQKGVLDIDGNTVRSFREKSSADNSTINAGYMVLEPAIFDYIEGDDTVFERETLNQLAEKGELMSYLHKGFWQCMDNRREMEILEKMWNQGSAPWKKWE